MGLQHFLELPEAQTRSNRRRFRLKQPSAQSDVIVCQGLSLVFSLHIAESSICDACR